MDAFVVLCICYYQYMYLCREATHGWMVRGCGCAWILRGWLYHQHTSDQTLCSYTMSYIVALFSIHGCRPIGRVISIYIMHFVPYCCSVISMYLLYYCHRQQMPATNYYCFLLRPSAVAAFLPFDSYLHWRSFFLSSLVLLT